MLPPLQRIPADVVAVADYEPLARERMTESAWAYLMGGAADELTLRDNCDAYSRLRLNGRVLASLAGGDTRVELGGVTLDHPILVAPVAYQTLAHPQGERATALGATAARAGMIVSAQASVPVEEIAREAGAPWWFQIYLQPDRAFIERLVRRVEAAGACGLVVTVDAPVSGVRNREWRANFQLPQGVTAVNLSGMKSLEAPAARIGESPLLGGPLAAAAATWEELTWLLSVARVPVWVKGIMTPADVVRAIERGVAGIVVSNHGGRTLDTMPATIDVLPEIVAAVAGRVPVLVDGGIRRGTDALKALALGAKAVLVGRPVVCGLAAAGPIGVAHVLHLLRAELEAAMALTGCARLDQVGPELIWRRRTEAERATSGTDVAERM